MELQNLNRKEKKAMRKLYSYAVMVFVALVIMMGAGKSYGQLFNYTPYPFISINQEDYYPDTRYLTPDALPGGERIFLVPVFVYNGVDVARNPNTANGLPKTDDQRIFGVDGQYLEPIRSFEFQVTYANQAIVLDESTERGSPIVTVGPTYLNAEENTKASPFYIQYTEQSANDLSNPFLRRVRVHGASEVPLPLSDRSKDSIDILCYLRFRILPNWVVNATILQLDSAKFADHVGDPQYDPINYKRGNLAGHAQEFRGRLRVEITGQPAFELRPVSAITSTDNKNFTLVQTLISDPAVPGASIPFTQLQLRNAVGNSRLTNINICTDQTWLTVSQTPGAGQQCIFIPRIDYTQSSGSEERNLFIFADPSGLLPGVYYGYVTLTSEGASNSPARILVKFIVRANPDEPSAGSGTGVHLTITNSCNPSCTNLLMFGTGTGATDGIDELFGEGIFTQSDRIAAENNPNVNNRCWAYFEPLNKDADIRFQDPEFAGTLRDIRSSVGDTTILYKVHFSPGNQNCYPVTVCMDPNDFPAGSRIIVRDTLNGSMFSYNMREATLLGGGQRCITIQDANINSFIIEYTRGSTGQVATLLANNWNFISLPVIPPNPNSAAIFPNATGTPFGYAANSGWTAANTLEFGRGYMVHYGDFIGGDNLVSGVRSKTISNIRMNKGWNAVGAPSWTACVVDINFTGIGGGPTPALISEVFDFTPTIGYNTVAYIDPGKGYFLRVDQEGFYNVTPLGGCKAAATADAELKGSLSKISVRDAAQNGQVLYFGASSKDEAAFQLPPIVRDFDARFANNSYISTEGTQHEVDLRSENFPVAMTFENINGTVEVRDVTGNLIGMADNKGTVVVSNENTSKVVITYKQSVGSVAGFALEANYPNPFAATTSFNYSVPAESFVTINVTNALGQEVASLVNSTVNAGSYNVKFDASNLANGTYFYTMKSGNFVKTIKMTVSK
jgi:hypothetical protein